MPSAPTPSAGEPSLRDVVRALAEAAPLSQVAARLQVSEARLRELIDEADGALRWMRAPAARTPLPAPEPAPPAPEPKPLAPNALRKLLVFTDGAARGNPGPAGAGAVLGLPDGTIIDRLGRYLGVQTNNVAEYQGVIIALRRALELGAREIDLRADSLLVISQLRGEWKVKNEGLRPLFEEARRLLARFDRVSLQHVRRELNTEADEMSNRAIDERM